MKKSNVLIMVIAYAVAMASIITTVSLVSGATANTITLDNSNRREYTYCPISDTIAKTNIEIDGCPLVRVYVNDWNRLTVLQQTTIDSQLRTAGFVDAGEHVVR